MSDLSLRQYQIKVLTKHMACHRFIDRSHMGTGKTVPSCVYSGYAVTTLNERVVWIQKGGLAKKNMMELLKWTGLPMAQLKRVVGTVAQKKAAALDPNVKIWLMTPEAWASHFEMMLAKFPDINTIICDEPHLYYRGWESKRTQAFYKSLQPKHKVRFLTGTLTPRGKLSSAYIYCAVINPNQYHGYDFFMRQHALLDVYGGITGWQNHEHLANFIEANSICITADEAYGKTEEFIIREPIEMTGKHLEIYKQFEAEGILDLKEAIMRGTTGGLAYLRSRQLLNSPFHVNLPVDWDAKGKASKWVTTHPVSGKDAMTGKMGWLSDAFESYEDPMVIFGTFHAELVAICELAKKMGRRPAMIDGTVPMAQREKIDEGFRNGTYDVLVGSADTCSTGYNWSHVNWIIHVSLDGSDDNFLQANFRAKRGVREHALRISILEYLDSMDSTMMWMAHENSKSSHKINPSIPVLMFPNLVVPTGFESLENKIC